VVSAGNPSQTRAAAAWALLLLVPAPSLAVAAAMYWWPGTLLGKGLFVAAKLWLVLLPVLWWRREKRGHSSFPDREKSGHSSFPGEPHRRRGYGVAILLGLAIAGAIVAVYAIARGMGWLDPATVADRAKATGLGDVRLYLLASVYWITANSLIEEFVWRWFVFRRFEELIGGGLAVLAAGLAFTAHHVLALAAQFSPAMAALGSFGVLVGGVIWSWLYLRYRSIWPCWVSHAIADVPIFVIGYRLIFGG
jgi:membrane protease YdiL (CAAX protease family)